MIPFLFLAAAFAAPPEGYTLQKETDDCVLFAGPPNAQGIAPMYAECHWPDVDPEKLQELLGVWDAYDKYISAIESCRIVKIEGSRTLVHQLQTAPAISDREVVVWMEKIPVEGGFRFTWQNDPSEPLDIAKGNIRPPKNAGFWEVTAHPESGSFVQHQVTYDPGGRVPAWLVRTFSVSGLAGVMSDVRGLAKAKSLASDDQQP